ncbi:MAG: tripartite tricarboxylate transporter TctB family protein [Pseudomonadota bacterium]
MTNAALSRRYQTIVGAGVCLVALGLAWGAVGIPADAGYSGVGPNFLPWLVSVALLLCGAFLTYEARSGGFRDMEEGDGDGDGDKPYWPGFVWMSAGLLLNAALITKLGFILSCALCFVMAARGLRNAKGPSTDGARSWVMDTVVGLLIAAPVYWMFTKFLAISLPGLTTSGWI